MKAGYINSLAYPKNATLRKHIFSSHHYIYKLRKCYSSKNDEYFQNKEAIYDEFFHLETGIGLFLSIYNISDFHFGHLGILAMMSLSHVTSLSLTLHGINKGIYIY